MMTRIDAHSSSVILNENKRITYIDAAKAFFMMVIVLDHSCICFHNVSNMQHYSIC